MRILLHQVDGSVEIPVTFNSEKLTLAVGLDNVRALVGVGIDEDLVLSADMPRDDFLVSVYVGRDVGFYSDEYFADENASELDFGDEDEG